MLRPLVPVCNWCKDARQALWKYQSFIGSPAKCVSSCVQKLQTFQVCVC